MSYFPINFNMVKYVTKMSPRYEGEVFTVSHIRIHIQVFDIKEIFTRPNHSLLCSKTIVFPSNPVTLSFLCYKNARNAFIYRALRAI